MSQYPDSSNYYVRTKINNTDNRYVSSNYTNNNYTNNNYTNSNYTNSNYTNTENYNSNNIYNNGNSRLREFTLAGRSVLLDTQFKR